MLGPPACCCGAAARIAQPPVDRSKPGVPSSGNNMKCIWKLFIDGTDTSVAWLDHKPNTRFAIYNAGTATNPNDDLVLDKETGLIWPRHANPP